MYFYLYDAYCKRIFLFTCRRQNLHRIHFTFLFTVIDSSFEVVATFWFFSFWIFTKVGMFLIPCVILLYSRNILRFVSLLCQFGFTLIENILLPRPSSEGVLSSVLFFMWKSCHMSNYIILFLWRDRKLHPLIFSWRCIFFLSCD